MEETILNGGEDVIVRRLSKCNQAKGIQRTSRVGNARIKEKLSAEQIATTKAPGELKLK